MGLERRVQFELVGAGRRHQHSLLFSVMFSLFPSSLWATRRRFYPLPPPPQLDSAILAYDLALFLNLHFSLSLSVYLSISPPSILPPISLRSPALFHPAQLVFPPLRTEKLGETLASQLLSTFDPKKATARRSSLRVQLSVASGSLETQLPVVRTRFDDDDDD